MLNRLFEHNGIEKVSLPL